MRFYWTDVDQTPDYVVIDKVYGNLTGYIVLLLSTSRCLFKLFH